MRRQYTASAWIGFDPREADAYCVAYSSLVRHSTIAVRAHGLNLWELRKDGLYTRPTSRDEQGRLFDDISGAPMATEFALTRFLVPHLAKTGLALFVDSDVLFRGSVARLLETIDPNKAVSVVKHNYLPAEGTKMDNQVQTAYPMKNWSSVMVFNCDHPANKKLTPELINTERGLHLHQFCWLHESDIGSIGEEWNWLEGHSSPEIDPKVVHFTNGIPRMLDREVAYADEWHAELAHWLA